MFQYDMLARSLASGNGFRWYAPADLARLAPYLHLDLASLALDPRGMLTTFRAPLYPAFVSVIYSVFGAGDGRFFVVRLFQAVLVAILAPLTYFAACRILRGSTGEANRAPHGRAPRFAAAVVAAYPMLLIFPLGLATENLFIPLVVASVLALLNLVESVGDHETVTPTLRSHAWRGICPGILLGLAALTRSVILPFAGLAILWEAFAIKDRRAAVVTALALIATIVPWMLRNSIVAHRPTGIETSMGYNLYVGYHPLSTGTFTFGPSLDLLSILDDQARDAIGTQRALEFIRQDPLRVPYLAVRRLGYFFNVELRAFTYFYVNDFLGPIPPPMLIGILIVLGLPFAVLGLSAAFGAAGLPRRPETSLLALLLVGYLLPHVLILSEERFHLTLIPFLAICAAYVWTNGLAVLETRATALRIAVIVAALLVANWCFQVAGAWPVLGQMLAATGNQQYLPY